MEIWLSNFCVKNVFSVYLCNDNRYEKNREEFLIDLMMLYQKVFRKFGLIRKGMI